jgi:D-lactate dehydrogenase
MSSMTNIRERFSESVEARKSAWPTDEKIIRDLENLLTPSRVLGSLMDRVGQAGDASIYRLTPRVVVRPENEDDLQAILDYARKHALYLTYRAAGTSLSGQAVTDGILVDVAHHWKAIEILDGGARVRVQPGVIAAHVNAYLAPNRRKIGPDPASIQACMMGGVVANNASGMCCGVQFNTYNTLAGMRFVLADGWIGDSNEPDFAEKLQSEKPDLWDGLTKLRAQIMANPQLVERVRRKFSIKNTTGYAINALVDFESPADILVHLLVGSEGTLGFVSDVTLNTLPDKPHKATAMAYFRDIRDAGQLVAPLELAGADVLEIMDRAAMQSVAHDMHYGFELKGNCAALLIEFQDETAEALDAKVAGAKALIRPEDLLAPADFSRDPTVQAHYWHMRKGLYPSVGAMRAIGTAVIIEDVCVNPARLAEAIEDIQSLFVKYSFPDAIIFGHARNGNVHFVICTDFADPEQVRRYAGLMDELSTIIVDKYDGSLKAEHGTGRNIAPFVEREWGPELTQVMWDIKGLLDPQCILNPGVVLTDDPEGHLKDLKVMLAVSPVVDKCIECGFCEPRCPSRDVTLSPRQRIAVLREIARLAADGTEKSRHDAEELRAAYAYSGDATCATDGMCATACPVDINTGTMIKQLREHSHPDWSRTIARTLARNFGLLAFGARAGLAAAHIAGPVSLAVARVGARLGNLLSGGKTPALPEGIPVPQPAPSLPSVGHSHDTHLNGGNLPGWNAAEHRLPVYVSAEDNTAGEDRRVVYFATCLTRSMGSIEGEPSEVGVAQAIVDVLEACGYEVIYPRGLPGLCCGQPFSSKGFPEAGAIAAAKSIQALYEATEHGKLPVICDTSPCTGQFVLSLEKAHHSEETRELLGKLEILDLSQFLARKVIPLRTRWPQARRHAVLHPTCTLHKIGALPDLRKVAQTFAERATVPIHSECCGFAGDRGFLHPELTGAATAAVGQEVRSLCTDSAATGQGAACYSTCRTCELGMTAATGHAYGNIIHLVREALASPQRKD